MPKAVFGTLEESLNSSSLALSPWLCVSEKRQKRQAQWNAFLWSPLKTVINTEVIECVWFPFKMLLSETHREFICIITLQARNLSLRGYHYLNLSQVIIVLHAELLGRLPSPSLDSCSCITLNESLTSSSSRGELRTKGSASTWKEPGLRSNKDRVQIPAPLPTWENDFTTSEMQTMRFLRSLTDAM